jgi:hypothetical protein
MVDGVGFVTPPSFQIGPNQRYTVNPPMNGSFGMMVQSTGAYQVPIVAERSMYWGSG